MGNMCNNEPKVNVDHETLTENNVQIDSTVNYDEQFAMEHEIVKERLESMGEYPFDCVIWEVEGAEQKEEV